MDHFIRLKLSNIVAGFVRSIGYNCYQYGHNHTYDSFDVWLVGTAERSVYMRVYDHRVVMGGHPLLPRLTAATADPKLCDKIREFLCTHSRTCGNGIQ